ncbi:6532_t:CDS:2 [Racocetra persica]|uniref:6532_t:CDS:1 n=1 Tax=Racocetra persica TaxID=160502 RepID=A0ACA9KIK8_9GLOM|nr:6532_t:CDS:2 [Racocetra persica]
MNNRIWIFAIFASEQLKGEINTDDLKLIFALVRALGGFDLSDLNEKL